MKKILYKKDSKGKIREWVIYVRGSLIGVTHGLIDGKKIIKQKEIKEGKNIGKKNETTPEEQALLEAESTWNHQKDKGYFETIEEAETEQIYLPMLAHMFTKRKHNIDYFAYVQPKFDGIRCLCKKISNFDIDFMSRGGKKYKVLQRHPLREELLEKMKVGEIYDGEIYKHSWSLQRITSAVKKFSGDTLELEYWVYDIANDETFQKRLCKLPLDSVNIKHVKTYMIWKEEEVYKHHDQFVKEGFEGVIIRNAKGLYTFGSRSKDLQKYKQFIDEEFEIIGFGVENQNINGVDYECIMYQCKTKDGDEFDCRPKGTLLTRQELYRKEIKNKQCIGKMLTVRYFQLTDDTQGEGKKLPQFPVGICIRDYE